MTYSRGTPPRKQHLLSKALALAMEKCRKHLLENQHRFIWKPLSGYDQRAGRGKGRNNSPTEKIHLAEKDDLQQRNGSPEAAFTF